MAMHRVVFVALLLAASASAQIPERFENLQYFPKDIPRDSLVQQMRTFSLTLGVRCQYCHAGGDGVSFAGVNFASDEKPAKRKARYMLRMRDSINTVLLAGLPDRRNPPVVVACVTCHRGLAFPSTLEDMLNRTMASKGIDSAVAQYRQLRRTTLESGKFDFTEWSINEMARRLREAGKTAEAITMLELNQEFYPNSADIDYAIAELHFQRNERDRAIARYRATLQKNPQYRPARERLAQMGVTP
jgi:tetratricopeptide (TPR) repeat protein